MGHADVTYLVTDPTTGEIREEIPVVNAAFSDVLNAPSAATITCPLASSKIKASNIILSDTLLWILVDGSPVWGGLIWDDNVAFDQKTVSFSAMDFLSYYMRRYLTVDKTYNAAGATIVSNLVTWAKTLTGGDIGTAVSITGTSATANVTWPADEWFNLYELFENMSLETGFDFTLTYTGSQATSFGHTLHLAAPSYGRKIDKTAVNLDLGRGNLRVKRASASAWDRTNRTHAINNSQDNKIGVTRSDAADINGSKLFEKVNVHSDVASVSRMNRRADADLKRNLYNRQDLTVEVDGNDVDVGIGKLIVGDTIWTTLQYGYLQVNRWMRVMEKTTRVDDAGTITLIYGLTDARAFDVT